MIDNQSFSNQRPDRKSLQLASQVAEVISMVLCEQEDDLVRDLMVESVIPLPNGSRLLVSLTPAISARSLDLSKAMEHLQSVQAAIKSEVANSITRRKVPDLIFRILPGDNLKSPDYQ